MLDTRLCSRNFQLSEQHCRLGNGGSLVPGDDQQSATYYLVALPLLVHNGL